MRFLCKKKKSSLPVFRWATEIVCECLSLRQLPLTAHCFVCLQKLGPAHGEELPYVFGAPLAATVRAFPSNYSKSEVALSEAIMTYWTNFARTG